jgi:hypothetical protein
MDLDRPAAHPQRHLVAIDLGDCGKKRVGSQAAGVLRPISMSLYISAIFQRMP